MSRLEIVRDTRSGYFVIPVMIRKSGSLAEGSDPWVHLEMFLDTGATRSVISESVALQLGLDPDRLEQQPVVGVGSVTKQPFIRNLSILLIVDGTLFDLALEQVAVMSPLRQKVKGARGQTIARRGHPIIERGQVQVNPGFCLFGLDALAKLQATVTIDMKTGKAEITW